MKNIFLLLAILLFQNFICGQTNAAKISPAPKAIVDTIPVCSAVFVGENVVSFNATIIYHGICMTRKIYGPSFPEGSCGLKTGDAIIADEIISVDGTGKQIKLPPRKYVVR